MNTAKIELVENEIVSILTVHQADFIRFVDVSGFSIKQNRELPNAIHFGIALSRPLPHKTIAVLSGIGWIGKNNLLVTPEYGSALCLGVVLTDAPLNTTRQEIVENKCGKCNRFG